MAARCPNCAALASEHDQAVCAFCGHDLPRVEPPPAPRAPTVDELLAEVERHPQLRAWRAHRPSSLGAALGLGVMVVFGLAFSALAGLMVIGFGRAVQGGALFTLAPLVFVVAGLAMALTAVVRGVRHFGSPLLRRPALVLDERVEVSGGGGDSSATTTYYATLELAGGERREYRTGGRVAGALASGDYGLAYLRADTLLDFRRVGRR